MAEEQALWYVVHTYSGYENKVATDLKKTVANNGMTDLIQDVMVPIEEVVEVKNGKQHVIQHKIFPGYVLVKMLKTTETWYVVRNTRGVTGFVGPGSEPIPLTDEEFQRMTNAQGTIRIDLQPGDTVRIKEGSRERIQAFEGTIIAKRGSGVSETFTVRRVSYGVGVERVFPVNSPNVTKVTVVRSGKVRRAKLYYLRDRVGKAAKVKEKI